MENKNRQTEVDYHSIRINEVNLALSFIFDLLQKEIEIENYEDCCRLRDTEQPLQEFLDGKKTLKK